MEILKRKIEKKTKFVNGKRIAYKLITTVFRKRDNIFYKFGFPTKDLDSINEFGTRSQIPDKNAKKIVCLGCSHTYGKGLEQEDTWPYKLGENIQMNKKEHYQVLNMGRRSYGSKILIDWYDFFVDKNYKPHMCIFQLPNYFRQPHPTMQPNKMKFYTSSMGITDLYKKGIIGNIKFESQFNIIMNKELQRLKCFFAKIQKKDIKLVVVFYLAIAKFIEESDARKSQIQYFDLIEEFCDNNNIDVVRSHKLDYRYFRDNDMTVDYTHPNEKGTEFFSNEVYKTIERYL
jgi:hypothetical protein